MADIVPIKKHRAYNRQVKQSAAGCLRNARAKNPTQVVVVGYDEHGDLFVIGSPPDPGNAFWLMESAKAWLVR